jgi:hypothetical protein
LAARIAATAARAQAAAAPAQLRYGAATVPGVAANRQAAGGNADETVRVLATVGATGQCRGVVAAFGCHPTILPPENRRYSRDLFGAAVDLASQRLAAPVLLFNGTAADVSTRFSRREQSAGEVQRLGALLADGIVRAAHATTALSGHTIEGRTATVAVTARELPAADAAQNLVAAAAARLQEAAGDDADAGARRRLAAQLEGALAQAYLAAHGGGERLLGRRPATALVQHIGIGGCDVVAAPGELFTADGERLRAAASRPALLIGYANDYLGYLAGTAAMRAGEYESLVALLSPASADAVVGRLIAMRRRRLRP